jgi:hypothetical protein
MTIALPDKGNDHACNPAHSYPGGALRISITGSLTLVSGRPNDRHDLGGARDWTCLAHGRLRVRQELPPSHHDLQAL